MMNKFPKVSIIIAANRENTYLKETICECLKIDYPNFDIIVVSTEIFKNNNNKIIIIPVGNKSPAFKRGIGVKHSNAEIVAFIDDDAYPKKDWLKKAIPYFEDKNIVGVGGPGITPENDSFMKRIGGFVLESHLCSGTLYYRYKKGKNHYVDDYHSCNLILRRNLLKQKWFHSNSWPGEDTELVLNLINNTKGKVLYAGDVIVFHHRRALFRSHLKQIYGYGRQRGFFAKILPETSRRLTYFIPSIFVLYIFSLILMLFLDNVNSVFLLGLYIYIFLILISSIKNKRVQYFPLLVLGILSTHIIYGLSFFVGFIFGGIKR